MNNSLPEDAQLAAALHGALQAGASRKAYEEALGSLEGVPGFCLALLRVQQQQPLGQPERLLAVLCLKNAVTRRWLQRSKSDPPSIPAEEKSTLRDALLAMLDEPDAQVWAQLELTIASIGKLDGLAAWPPLMPTLLEAASRPSPRAAARGLSALYRVIKQQERRLLADRKQFFTLAEQLLPRLAPLRQAHAASLLSGLAQRAAPADAAAWLDSSAATAAAADGYWLLRAATWLCKIERQLLLHGWPHLHTVPEACALLGGGVDLMEAVDVQHARLAAAARQAEESGGGDGGGGGASGSRSADGAISADTLRSAADSLMPLLLVPSKALAEVQDLQPLAMQESLARAIAFSLRQLSTRTFTHSASGDGETDDEKFLVRTLLFLKNALSTSAYMATRTAPPQAHACREVLLAFFGSPALPQLVTALLTRALPLSTLEYDEYLDEPEAFVYEEHLSRETVSLRKCAEKCLLVLADTAECRAQVQETVRRLSNEAAGLEGGLASLHAVLALDGCYLALGLVLQSGSMAGAADAQQLGAVLSTLIQHCGLAHADHAHLLRRRAAWLLGWILRAPQIARIQRVSGGGATLDDAALLMYNHLSQLLTDSHAGVRLSAALAVQSLFDATDVSPRADSGSPAVLRQRSAGSSGGDSGGAGGGAGEAAVPEDPLAQLASAALLQVLHFSLHVTELSARWRMGQLLSKLLARLADAPHLLLPHLPSLSQWMPTAWEAAAGEQLMQESTLDLAATMLLACDSPQLTQIPPQLIAAALELVNQATLSHSSTASNNEEEDAEDDDDDGPPIGLVEIALKLWKAVLAVVHSTSPSLGPEVATALLSLAARLPDLAGLADETMRPTMLLIDWYLLTDATLSTCGGAFAERLAPLLAPTFERALGAGHRGKGTLAAVGALHTFLMVAPDVAKRILHAPLAVAVAAVIAPGGENSSLSSPLSGGGGGGTTRHNELITSNIAGVLGRALLTSPELFQAACAQAGGALSVADAHIHLASRWLALADAIPLTSQRKLACLALAQLVALDAKALPLLPELLSFCVSVVAEIAELPPSPGLGLDGKPTPTVPSMPAAGEHASFARRLAAASLDPLPSLDLKATLQQRLQHAAATHGEAFEAQMRGLDPALLQQVQAVLR